MGVGVVVGGMEVGVAVGSMAGNFEQANIMLTKNTPNVKKASPFMSSSKYGGQVGPVFAVQVPPNERLRLDSSS